MTTANDRDLDLQADGAPLEDESAIEPDSGDLPQEITESYGTGVHDQPGFAMGGRTMRDRLGNYNEASAVLTGGDIDANFEQANAVGDESVGGTSPTPDMDVVDELGAAVGLEMDDAAFLRTTEILEQRDSQRWELEPKSSEDYADRRTVEADEVLE
ncbi:MAG TPA: DUF6335 family protein [Thermosynechococcaceae cyanobacterium]